MASEGYDTIVEEAQPNKVFVANLSFETSLEDLNAHLASFNINATEATLFEDRNGNSKGCAMLTLENESDVATAIDSLVGTTLGDRELFARADRGPRAPREPKSEKPKRRKKKAARAEADGEYEDEAEVEAEEAPADPCALYIGNLAWSIDDAILRDTFSAHGEITKAEVARERRGDRSQGWGVVEFASADSATAATEALHGAELFERQIVVEMRRGAKKARKPRKKKTRANRAEDGADGEEAPVPRRRTRRDQQDPADIPTIAVENAQCHLFVGNLAWDAVDSDLFDLFSQHGSVVSATVVRDKRSERSRGYGTVQMSGEAECGAAIDALNETSFMERDLTVRQDNRVSSQ